jgi:hypothetical protein
MTEIKIPSITIDTPMPYDLNLRAEGQPLRGLRQREHFVRILRVQIWENRLQLRTGTGEVINYTVRTVGLTPQTKREKKFHVTEREAMVKYVNEWLVKTVTAGLKKIAEQKVEEQLQQNNQRAWMAKRIEEAGGVEARRQQILREGENIAAKEAMQYEMDEIYGAIMTSLITRSRIAIDIDTRAKIIARYEENVKTSWRVKSHVDARMQELDAYLAEIKTEDAA